MLTDPYLLPCILAVALMYMSLQRFLHCIMQCSLGLCGFRAVRKQSIEFVGSCEFGVCALDVLGSFSGMTSQKGGIQGVVSGYLSAGMVIQRKRLLRV